MADFGTKEIRVAFSRMVGPRTDPANIPLPESGYSAPFIDLNGCWGIKKDDGTVLQICGSTVSGPLGVIPALDQMLRWAQITHRSAGSYPYGGGLAGDEGSMGDLAQISGSVSGPALDANEPGRLRFTTGPVSGNQAGISGGANMVGTGQHILFRTYIGPVALTSCRVWACLSSQNLSSVAASDTPPLDCIGFRYSSAVGPNWYRVTAANGPGSTVQDTGLAASASGLLLSFRWNPGTGIVQFATGANDTDRGTITATIPANTTGLKYVVCVTTLTGGTRSLDVTKVFWGTWKT